MVGMPRFAQAQRDLLTLDSSIELPSEKLAREAMVDSYLEISQIADSEIERIRANRDTWTQLITAKNAVFGSSGAFPPASNIRLQVVASVARKEDCSVLLVDGAAGAYEVSNPARPYFRVGQRIVAVIELTDQLSQCSDHPFAPFLKVEVSDAELLDGEYEPGPEQFRLEATVRQFLRDEGIDAMVTIHGSYVEITGIGLQAQTHLVAIFRNRYFDQYAIIVAGLRDVDGIEKDYLRIWPTVGSSQ